MTRQLKIGLFIFIIIAISAALYLINTSSQSNSAQAGYDLYQQGETEAAFALFQKNAESDSQSAYALAVMYKEGIGTPPDDSKAQYWLEKSASQNNKSALYNLGFYRYNQEIEGTPDDLYGLVSLTKSADFGVQEAQIMVGSIYIADKTEKIPQDIELARQYFTLAAKQDSQFAKFALGYIAHDFDKDNKKAVEILTPLVSKNFPLPAMLLATIYTEGGNGVTPNKFFAEKYERISMASALEFVSDTNEFEPAPLSIYGSQTPEEKQKIIENLEERARQGDELAIYILYQKYMFGDGVKKDKNIALAYLRPLIQQRSPKALYLNYLTDKNNLDDLIEAADLQYPDAMYQAYQVYSGNTFNFNIERNDTLANKYLMGAADLGHHDALVEIVEKSITSYQFPNRQLIDLITKYTPILMERYPNSPEALVVTSQVYGKEDSPLYSPEKSFSALEKANKIAPDYNSQVQLARYYIRGFGTKTNLEKAVNILKSNLDDRGIPSTANRLLVQLYYHSDIQAYIDERTIIDILKNDVIERENYELAHFYANYLLQENPEKNSKLAFDLFEKSSEYSQSAHIHYAAALLKYKPEQTDFASKLIVNLLSSESNKAELTPDEKDAATDILLKIGFQAPETKSLLINLALYDKNSKAIALVEPQVGIDADITYLYGITKLTQLTEVDSLSNDELKPYYDTILNAAELGSSSAHLYIAQNLDSVNYYNRTPYYKARFQQITGLTPNDLIPKYKKCAELGNNRCLYELGEIYQVGKYGEDPNYDIALEYYGKISDPDFSFLKSRKSEIAKSKANFIQIQNDAKNNNPEALRTLANAYKFGNYGQKIDEKKWLEYLTISAKFNNQQALNDLVDYYSQDQFIDANKAKILAYYDQLAELGDQHYTRELAHQYLNGSRLVEPDRQKAREYYIKSGSWGDQYIRYMNKYDLGMKMLNESPSAKFNVGDAYLYGNGVKQDTNEAIKYLKQASDEGNNLAIRRYTELLYMGIYDKEKHQWLAEPDWDNAIFYLRKHTEPERVKTYIDVYETLVEPAQKGDAAAYAKLGDWYYSWGNNAAAQLYYIKSIDAGNIAAYRPLDSVTEDPLVKRQNYLDGTAKNDLYSKVQLAQVYLHDANIDNNSPDYNLALQYLDVGMKSTDAFISDSAFESLANLYKNGILLENDQILRPINSEKYLELIQNQAEKRPDALIRLYDYYASIDKPKALDYLYRAHQQGDLNATFKLYEINNPGEYCTNSRNADIDKSSIYLKEWLDKKQFGKNTDRSYIQEPENLSKKMGDVYLDGSCDMPKNIDKAIEWYLISLNYHDTHALNNLYLAYVEKKDAKQAYYIALRLEKDPENIELLGTLLPQERQEIDQRVADEQAFQKYGRFAQQIEEKRLKAEAGDRIEAFSLGISYARGEMVPEDTQKMIYYYELAGKNGYSRAYNILGNLYRKDNERGIEKDFPKALYYFDLGAQQNDSNTAHLAGDMHYFGQGIPKDYIQAAKYYEITNLEQGTHHAMAKYKLAYMYYNGLVGTKSKDDIQKAHDYLEMGAKYLDKDSMVALKEWDFSILNQ